MADFISTRAAMLWLAAGCICMIMGCFSCASCASTSAPAVPQDRTVDQTNQTEENIEPLSIPTIPTATKIVGPGGLRAAEIHGSNERPRDKMLALVQTEYQSGDDILYNFCSGSLITNQSVLTTAYCCLSPEAGTIVHGFYITIGADLISSTWDIPPTLPALFGSSSARFNRGHLEYVRMLPGQVFWPPAYEERVNDIYIRRVEWNVCIIKLGRALTTVTPIDTMPMVSLRTLLPLKPDTEVYIIGWGSQNDANHSQPSTSPMSLITKTTTCPGLPAPPAGDPEARFPGFICIGAPQEIGGPCKGDAGGPLRRFYPSGSRLAYRLRGVLVGSNAPLVGLTSCLEPGLVNFYLNLATPRMVHFMDIVNEAILAQLVG